MSIFSPACGKCDTGARRSITVSMRLPFRLLLAALWLALTSGAGALMHQLWVPAKGTLPGIRVEGETVTETSDLRARIEVLASERLARRVRMLHKAADGDRVVLDATLAELGVEADVDRAVAIVEATGRDADLVARARLAAMAHRGEIDVPLSFRVRSDMLDRAVRITKVACDTPPIEARLDLDRRAVIPETDGTYLDLAGTQAALLGLARDRVQTSTQIALQSYKPAVSQTKLAAMDISRTLGTYETRFGRGGRQASRARNIEVASSRLNGLVLQPGAVVSFNQLVGARTAENGFLRAGEIFRGEMIEGVGGGTCQVASTLHAAVMFAGLDVVERLPHSRPSAYIPMGLDATVVFPAVDFKFRNPFAFPVALHAKIGASMLMVEVLGAEKPVTVSFSQTVVGSRPYKRKVVEDQTVETPVTKQKGLKGYTIRRARTLAFATGERRIETSLDTYPPTIEIFRVPPGFDPTELPPLPDGEEGTDGA